MLPPGPRPQSAPFRVDSLMNPIEALPNSTRRELPSSHSNVTYERPLAKAMPRPPAPQFPASLYPFVLLPGPGVTLTGSDIPATPVRSFANTENGGNPRNMRAEPASRRSGANDVPSSARGMLDQRRQYWIGEWVKFVSELGERSDIFIKYRASCYAAKHFEEILAGDATNSIAKHLASASIWKDYAVASGFPIGVPLPEEVADFVLALSEGGMTRPQVGSGSRRRSRQVRAAVSTVVQAIQWIARRVEAELLLVAFSDTLVEGYMRSKKAKKQRREAPPLPLAFVVKFEQRFFPRPTV